jgi:hypothetical protein
MSDEKKDLTPTNEKKQVAVKSEMDKAISLLNDFENHETEEMNEQTSIYQGFEPGDEVNLIYTGLTTITNDANEQVDACEFLNKDRQRVINADIVLVGTCKKLTAPCLVRIICKGEIKTKKGKYKDLHIYTA